MIWTVLTAAAAPDWQDTIDAVLHSVLVIEMDRTRPFDGNSQSSSQATGFVVDAEQGLVLTNRHVVTHGPTRARGIFPDKVEVTLVPLYADPIHDFGLFRYDPSAVPDLTAVDLELAPEGAKVGVDIRVIGNDAAEQMSILAGTLSRLDREAPHWDQDTFYLQAASGTSGGSSGSPVFDIQGRVVGLNAGSRRDAATAMYLPLERVERAVDLIRQGQVPSRGTLQTWLVHESWPELRRLGITPEQEATAKAAGANSGMLVVRRVTPGSPAQGQLAPGDVIHTLVGDPVHTFIDWESVLDDAVGDSVALQVLRGGQPVTAELPVQDLHDLTPSAYIELNGGILHPVGLHSAIRAPRAARGIEVARAGRVLAAGGIGNGSVLTSIDDVPVGDLDSLQAQLEGLADGQVASVRYSPMASPNAERETVIRMERGLWPAQRCARAPSGRWPCTPLAPAPDAVDQPPQRVVFPPFTGKKKHTTAAHSLVKVLFQPGLNLDSVKGDRRQGMGIVLDRDGLVLTDAYTVPVDTGTPRIQVADGPSVAAEILYRDPVLGQVLLRIEPGSLALPADWEPPVFHDTALTEGDALTLIALDTDARVYAQPLKLERVSLQSGSAPDAPRYFVRNRDSWRIGDVERPVRGGVLVDKKGRVVALQQAYAWEKDRRLRRGLSLTDLSEMRLVLDRYRRGVTEVADLGVVFRDFSLSEARERGFPAQVAPRMREAAPTRAQVLSVRSVSGSSPAHGVLRTGDWLVAIDGRVVTDGHALAAAVEAGSPTMTVSIVRSGREMEVQVEAQRLPVGGTSRAALWSGVLVQEEPPEVALAWQTPAEGLYLSWYYGGSPAQRDGVGYAHRLLELDGQPVNSLDDFLDRVDGREDGSPVRLLLQRSNGTEWLVTVRLDQEWWPTMEFVRGGEGWQRVE